MKKRALLIITFTFAIASMIFLLGACGKSAAEKNLWQNASFRQDAEFGTGGKSFVAEVKAGEKSVSFTLHTDASTVGEALLEHDLISGEDGQYGLYVKTVNGITADYDKDKSYWLFYADGELTSTAADRTEIDEGVKYAFVYTK